AISGWLPPTVSCSTVCARDAASKYSVAPCSSLLRCLIFSILALIATLSFDAMVNQLSNVQGQRWEPVADDGSFVSERIGWLPFAASSGSAASSSNRPHYAMIRLGVAAIQTSMSEQPCGLPPLDSQATAPLHLPLTTSRRQRGK